MLTKLLPAVALLSASLLAQYPSDGITVTVTRNIAVPEPRAAISVQLNVKGSTTLEQILEAFAPLELKSSDIVQSGLYAGPTPDQTNLSYTLNIAAASGQLPDVTRRLIRIRNATDWILGLNAYTPGPTPPAPFNWDSQRATLLPEMLAEARTRAAELAQMAEVRLGSVTGIIDPASTAYPQGYPSPATVQVYLTVRFATSPR